MADRNQPLALVRDSPEPAIRLVAGLGNPGPEYAATRHNIGFMVADALAGHWGIGYTDGGQCRRAVRAVSGGPTVILAKPMAYMNRSGLPLLDIFRQFSLTCRDLVVIHDDLDLALGRLKIKKKGGDGGHKGLRSIMDALGGDDFIRIRVGIGRPDAGTTVLDHVLGDFSAEERAVLLPVVSRAREAAVTVLFDGIREAMARFNVKRNEQSS